MTTRKPIIELLRGPWQVSQLGVFDADGVGIGTAAIPPGRDFEACVAVGCRRAALLAMLPSALALLEEILASDIPPTCPAALRASLVLEWAAMVAADSG